MVMHPSREGGPVHTDQCKKRLIDKLKATPEGRARVDQAEKRQSECIVRRIHRTEEEDQRASTHAENSREERLDHEEEGGAQFRHEDESAEMDIEKKDESDQVYDMFMEATDELSEAGSRERMAAEVNSVTREILHLAMNMGVTPSEFAPQLSRTWGVFIKWTNGEGVGEGVEEPASISETLASEELMMMKEATPGRVDEQHQKPHIT